MSVFSVNVLQFRDRPFNIGVKTGEAIQHHSIIKTFEALTKDKIDVVRMRSIYATYAPHLLEELDGLAQGLDISFSKAAAMFSGYDVPKTEAMGCSAVATPDYYVRNYDFAPELYDGVFSLVQSEHSYASAGYSLQIVGRHEGVNEKGVVIGLHFVSNYGYTTGLAPWMAVRMVLDTCSSVDEATVMLKEMPHAACYNFSVGDNLGNSAVVEATPDKVVVRPGQSSLACANHFQDALLKSNNRTSIEGSTKRHNYLDNLEDKKRSHEEMFHHFSSVTSPVFFTDYKDLFGTLHTFSYAYSDARILTTIAQSSHVLDINFQQWVKGEDLNVHCLKGFIEDN
ncbi:C45 family peptidase [Thalassobacillus sp. CUG 92003]|uniref:C45 family autoproteolytic acyltransferase/hydolase n=1 Tax=Thalassobacillus sp. CUG 92003 TaxID=2736641 RepID=UPI0015E74CEE|nr:C45 family peptidase [Thalassobacillus sp. CUG 92003]